MSYYVRIIFVTLIVLCFGCEHVSNKKEIPVARVFDMYLYQSDLKEQIPDGINPEDSSKIAHRIIDEWVRNKLLLKQSEIYLPDSQKDIENQVEEYRSSLLIYKYKQYLLTQNLDTTIRKEEISGYYEENSSNYILDSDIIKVTYLKIPKTAPQISRIRQIYRYDRDDYVTEIEEYAKKYAESHIIRSDKWIKAEEMIAKTSLNIDNPGRYLDYNTNIESSDSLFFYFIHIIERMKESEIAPLEFVNNNIKSVLMNKRKLQYIQDLENNIYKEGLSRNQATIY